MSRLCLIALMSFLLSTVEAQQFKVDTLYSGLKNPTSFLLANNAIYIVEQGNHRILKLDLNGNLIEKYGNRGSGNYQFDSPTDIASSTGLKIFVSDPGNNRIQVFDKRWQYLSSIKGNDKFRTRDEISPEYIGVNKQGEIFFYDSRSKSIGKYDEDGAYLDQIPIPSDIKEVSGLQTSESKIFILDKKSELIHRLSENGFYETYYDLRGATVFEFKHDTIIRGFSDSNKVRVLFEGQQFSPNGIIYPSFIKDMIYDSGVFFLLVEENLISLSLSK